MASSTPQPADATKRYVAIFALLLVWTGGTATLRLLGYDFLGTRWYVWLTLGSVLLLLFGLALSYRVFPYRGLLLLALVPALASVGMLASEGLVALVLAADVAVGLVALADLATIPRRTAFTVERQMSRTASVARPHRVTLTVVNHAPREHTVWVRDSADQDLHAAPDEFQLRLAARSRATFHYQITSSRRGAFSLPRVHLRVRSRLAIWQRLIDYPVPGTLHVYPDMKQLGEYALMARKNRLQLLGVRRTRRIGQDNEFERLRDYTPDDNYKYIDWRSTARRRKLTVKDFQTNQSQRVIFLLDCGRMMTNEAAGLSLLDHALNSMLMLSYVALSRGDSVGMLAFSDEIHGFVPPRSGERQMNALLHAAFDRFPRLVESRYDQAFLYLSAHHRRRSLVILITNVVDEVNAHQVERYLGTLVGKHLPLGVLLRDRQMFDAADMKRPGERVQYEAAAAADILSWRHQVLADLHSKGVLSIDAFPEEMTAPLINRYLEIKARHLL